MKKLTRSAFEGVVKMAIEGLPPKIRKKMDNIAIVVEELPSREVIQRMGLRGPYDVLGLYQGISIDRRGFYYGNVLPDKIILYQKPIEAGCHSREEMVEKVQEVVLHEIGHYFGLDDQRLSELLTEEVDGGGVSHHVDKK
jgi:predicted Zn-dependent protease with MMP-like domain